MPYAGELPRDIDYSAPVGAESISLGDDAIREIKKVFKHQYEFQVVTANTALAAGTPSIVFVDASSGDVAVTLPLTTDVVSSSATKLLWIKRVDTSDYTVTVSAQTDEDIDGATSFVLLPGEQAILIPRSGAWHNFIGMVDGGGF
jgi:hypothetical protein